MLCAFVTDSFWNVCGKTKSYRINRKRNNRSFYIIENIVWRYPPDDSTMSFPVIFSGVRTSFLNPTIKTIINICTDSLILSYTIADTHVFGSQTYGHCRRNSRCSFTHLYLTWLHKLRLNQQILTQDLYVQQNIILKVFFFKPFHTAKAWYVLLEQKKIKKNMYFAVRIQTELKRVVLNNAAPIDSVAGPSNGYSTVSSRSPCPV